MSSSGDAAAEAATNNHPTNGRRQSGKRPGHLVPVAPGPDNRDGMEQDQGFQHSTTSEGGS